VDNRARLTPQRDESKRTELTAIVNSTLSTPQRVLIHSTAIVENNVDIKPGTAIWDNVHIRHGVRIGTDCIVGEKTYIAPGVHIGDRVKINAFVYVCREVTIQDGVMISAGVIFTNDRYPRATTPDLKQLRTSEPDEHTLPTLVSTGATIGAGSRIGCGLTVGRFAMVAMGSVVTKSVPDFALVMGTPARIAGYVCRCGWPLLRFNDAAQPSSAKLQCEACSRSYDLKNAVISERA
jgi:UDP-2-acetamido-3-amino-2,3-dideoxy-glucuronate N-acetyltransferase